MQQTLMNRAVAEYQTLLRIMQQYRRQAQRICHYLSQQQKQTDRTCPTEEYNFTSREDDAQLRQQMVLLTEEDDQSSMGIGLKNLASPTEGYCITNMKNQFELELNQKLSQFK